MNTAEDLNTITEKEFKELLQTSSSAEFDDEILKIVNQDEQHCREELNADFDKKYILSQHEIDIVVSTIKAVVNKIGDFVKHNEIDETFISVREKSAWLDGYNCACRDFQRASATMQNESLQNFLKHKQ